MPKSFSSKELIKLILKEGWILYSRDGSHHVFKHPDHPLNITIAHPRKDVTPGQVRDVERKLGKRIR